MKAKPSPAALALILLLAGCGPLAPSPTPEASPSAEAPPPAWAASIDAVAQQMLEETPLAGLTLAIQYGTQPAYVKGYGYADMAASVSAQDTTVYQIGSITKEFTAAAIMQLVEQGKMRLDDPVSKYVPELPACAQGILVRHLLNHTSGLPRIEGMDVSLDYARTYTPREFVALYTADLTELNVDPGTQFGHSNEGYTLLGVIIERVSGLTFADYLQQHIFTPLGLTSTSYCLSPPAGMAQGYRVTEGQFKPVEHPNLSIAFAAEDLCSTAGDLVKWQRALAEGRVVSPALYQMMITPQTLPDGRPLTYGYGLKMREYTGGKTIGHEGASYGFASLVSTYPAHDSTFALLTNTNLPTPEAFDTLASQIWTALLTTP